jgi:RNA polymerase-binding transcription factor DksA
MMSIEEKAQELECAEWEARNAPRPTRPTFRPGEPGYGPEECAECDDPMPDLRRTMGCHLCAPCQTAYERMVARGLRR